MKVENSSSSSSELIFPSLAHNAETGQYTLLDQEIQALNKAIFAIDNKIEQTEISNIFKLPSQE